MTSLSVLALTEWPNIFRQLQDNCTALHAIIIACFIVATIHLNKLHHNVIKIRLALTNNDNLASDVYVILQSIFPNANM